MKLTVSILFLLIFTSICFSQSTDSSKFSVGLHTRAISTVINKVALNYQAYFGKWTYDKSLDYGGVYFTYKPNRRIGIGMNLSYRVSSISRDAFFDFPTSLTGSSHNIDIAQFCGGLIVFHQSKERKKVSLITSTGITFNRPVSYTDHSTTYQKDELFGNEEIILSNTSHHKIDDAKFFVGTFASVGVGIHLIPQLTVSISLRVEGSQSEIPSVITKWAKPIDNPTPKLEVGLPITIGFNF